MFGRKKQASSHSPTLRLMNDRKQDLLNVPLNEFPFSESTIIAASTEFYGDAEPCEIRRRALQLRLCAEIQTCLKTDVDIPSEDAPTAILAYFEEYHPAFIRIDTQAT